MMRPRALRLVALLVFLFPCLAGTARAESDPWFGEDKRLHFGASASLALVGYGGAALVTDDRGLRAGVAAAFALDIGIAKELWDRAGHGDASPRDLAWDVVGTATGLAVAVAIDWAWQRIGGGTGHGR